MTLQSYSERHVSSMGLSSGVGAGCQRCVRLVLPSDAGQAYPAQLLTTAAKGGVGFHVPLHFDVEVVGQLVKHHRRAAETYTSAWLKQSLVTLDLLPIKTHALGINFKALGDLSLAYQLSAYDTPYFHLARMLGIGIASRDRGILAAASWGVEVWQAA